MTNELQNQQDSISSKEITNAMNLIFDVLHDVELECPKHGRYVAETVWFNKVRNRYVTSASTFGECPACRAERIARSVEMMQTAQETRQTTLEETIRRAELRKLAARFSEAGIPAAYWGKGFETMQDPSQSELEALEEMRFYIDNFDKFAEKGIGLVLFGMVGTGKTFMACALLQELIQQDVKCKYTSVKRIVEDVKRGYGENMTETQSTAEYLKADLLVIDEVGVQAGTQHEEGIMYSLVDSRVNNFRPTIFISNLNPTEAKKAAAETAGQQSEVLTMERVLGARTFDRIKGQSKFLVFRGESRRHAPKSLRELLGEDA